MQHPTPEKWELSAWNTELLKCDVTALLTNGRSWRHSRHVHTVVVLGTKLYLGGRQGGGGGFYGVEHNFDTETNA